MAIGGCFPDIDPHGFYSIGQAADLLGVHRSSIRRWYEDGDFPNTTFRRNGRKVFAGRDLIDKYTAKNG